MPRAIARAGQFAGYAAYVLSNGEEWTLRAMTFTSTPINAGPVDDAIVVDALDPSGGVIYRQLLGITNYQPAFFSVSEDAEPWASDGFGKSGFPQDLIEHQFVYVTARLTPVTLTAGCTLRVYACGAPFPGQDPFANLDTDITFPDLHLWVEDAAGLDLSAITVGNPILIGVGS